MMLIDTTFQIGFSNNPEKRNISLQAGVYAGKVTTSSTSSEAEQHAKSLGYLIARVNPCFDGHLMKFLQSVLVASSLSPNPRIKQVGLRTCAIALLEGGDLVTSLGIFYGNSIGGEDMRDHYFAGIANGNTEDHNLALARIDRAQNILVDVSHLLDTDGENTLDKHVSMSSAAIVSHDALNDHEGICNVVDEFISSHHQNLVHNRKEVVQLRLCEVYGLLRRGLIYQAYCVLQQIKPCIGTDQHIYRTYQLLSTSITTVMEATFHMHSNGYIGHSSASAQKESTSSWIDDIGIDLVQKGKYQDVLSSAPGIKEIYQDHNPMTPENALGSFEDVNIIRKHNHFQSGGIVYTWDLTSSYGKKDKPPSPSPCNTGVSFLWILSDLYSRK